MTLIACPVCEPRVVARFGLACTACQGTATLVRITTEAVHAPRVDFTPNAKPLEFEEFEGGIE